MIYSTSGRLCAWVARFSVCLCERVACSKKLPWTRSRTTDCLFERASWRLFWSVASFDSVTNCSWSSDLLPSVSASLAHLQEGTTKMMLLFSQGTYDAKRCIIDRCSHGNRHRNESPGSSCMAGGHKLPHCGIAHCGIARRGQTSSKMSTHHWNSRSATDGCIHGRRNDVIVLCCTWVALKILLPLTH